jgi:hypothetical protein
MARHAALHAALPPIPHRTLIAVSHAEAGTFWKIHMARDHQKLRKINEETGNLLVLP